MTLSTLCVGNYGTIVYYGHDAGFLVSTESCLDEAVELGFRIEGLEYTTRFLKIFFEFLLPRTLIFG